jgi:type I restriction enzyme S subunit
VLADLGDIYAFNYGKALPRQSRSETGDFPVFGSAGVTGYHNEFLVEGPSIIVGRKGAAGAVSFVKENSWPIDTTYFVKPPNGIDDRFAYYHLISAQLNQLEKSTAIPGLSRDDAYALKITLPPTNEQRRIVAKIEELFSELDKAVESLTTACEQLKAYRQSVLKHAFEGKLTADWRATNGQKQQTVTDILDHVAREREATTRQRTKDWRDACEAWTRNGRQGKKPAKPTTLPIKPAEAAHSLNLPPGWAWVRAEHLMEFITKGTTPSREHLFSGSGDIPFIKVYNLTKGGRLDFSVEPTFVARSTHDGLLSRSKVFPGDVLMNIVGPPLGKVSIAPDTYREWNVNQAIAIFRSNFISSKFLSAYLSWEPTVAAMTKKAKATAGQFNLTLELCRDIPIPLCSADEQFVIETRLETIDSQIEHLNKTVTIALAEATTIRQSILKQAFSGKLVAQDPNDEPASVLIERIRVEKEKAAPPEPKKRAKGATA